MEGTGWWPELRAANLPTTPTTDDSMYCTRMLGQADKFARNKNYIPGLSKLRY